MDLTSITGPIRTKNSWKITTSRRGYTSTQISSLYKPSISNYYIVEFSNYIYLYTRCYSTLEREEGMKMEVLPAINTYVICKNAPHPSCVEEFERFCSKFCSCISFLFSWSASHVVITRCSRAHRVHCRSKMTTGYFFFFHFFCLFFFVISFTAVCPSVSVSSVAFAVSNHG
jgi:hypothetical protein